MKSWYFSHLSTYFCLAKVFSKFPFMKLKPILQGLGLLAIIFTLLPFVAADYWWIRIFDFPHTQLAIFTLMALAAYFITFDIKSKRDYFFVILLTCCFIFQLLKILPYIPHGRKELMDSETENTAPRIKFYIANVLQDNKNPGKLLKEIERKDADVLLFMETDTRWMEQIRPAVKNYPYRMEVPLNNTYGMLLYSRLPFRNEKINYLVDDSIPSMEAILQLNKGEEIQLYTIHPTPPMPQHNPSSSDRDAEMMLIAIHARNNPLPVIVAGDFNDVAWSQSTSLFQDVSGLLDPRVGRGFFNTFNAKSHIMRWPLDHFFASQDFRLTSIKLGEDIDSDHFPAFFEMTLEPEKSGEQKKRIATKNQLENAVEQIQKARKEQGEKEKKKNLKKVQ